MSYGFKSSIIHEQSDEKLEVLNLCYYPANGLINYMRMILKLFKAKKSFSFPLMQSYWLIFRNYQKGKIVDLCAGNGAVGLFVSRKTAAKIDQIELQPRLADMGQRSILLNKLEKQVTMYERDLKQATEVIKRFCGFSTM